MIAKPSGEAAVETDREEPKGRSEANFTHQAILALTFFVFLVLFLWFLWYAAQIVLMFFLSILLAVFLRGLAVLAHLKLKLPVNLSLVLVIFALVAVFTFSAWALIPRVSAQIDILSKQLPRAIEHLKSGIEGYNWGKKLIAKIPGPGEVINSASQVLRQTFGIFATTLGVLTSVAIILFIGLYLAFDPQTYLKGIIRLIPQSRRRRADEVLHVLGSSLTHWLIGRFCAMAFVGIFVALGLWLMGIHLALTLSIIAALLDFVPYLGPIVAVLPAVLLALLESPAKVFYILVLYAAVLSFEGYVFTPLVQQREVSVPPVLILTSQIVMGLLFGIMGLVLATPLAACAVVLVRMLYVEDVLGDRLET